MNTEDDQGWLEALAGRSTAQNSSADRNEGALLRGELRRRHAQIARQPDAPTDGTQPTVSSTQRAETLIARAARDGLMDPVDASSLRVGRRRQPTWRVLLAAAALAGVAVGIAWQLRAPNGALTVRNAAAPIVRLTARDPVALKRTILGELRLAGVEANGYEALGVQGIDADLPQPLSPGVRQVLASHRIPEPRDGVLRIEIRELR